MLHFARIGDWQIWIYTDDRGLAAVMGTEVIQYPTGLRSIVFLFCTGRNRKKWQHHMVDVLAWAKAVGCGLAQGPFRIGWRRVLSGWSHSHDFLERPL